MSRTFPKKPLPPPNIPDVNCITPIPLSNYSSDNRRLSIRRPISQKDAFSKVLSNNNPVHIDDSNWVDTDEEYYEYTNADGEIIEPDGAIALALWDFNGEKDTDLSFKKGDNIKIITRYSNGWWEGELDGIIGDFPCNFVHIEDEDDEEEEEEEEEIIEIKPQQSHIIKDNIYNKPQIQQTNNNNTNINQNNINLNPNTKQSSNILKKNPLSNSMATTHDKLAVIMANPRKPPPQISPKSPPQIPAIKKTTALSQSDGALIPKPKEKINKPQGLPIKEGFLTKKGHKRRNWKVRYFVLESQSLSYYKNPGDFLAKRKAKGSILLQRSTMVRVAPEMKRSNCFAVSGGLGLLYITAPTGEEMVDWIDKISTAKPE